MTRIRKTVIIEKELNEKWHEFSKLRFSSDNEMIKTAVLRFIEQETNGNFIQESLKPIDEKLSAIYSLMDKNNEIATMTQMKIFNETSDSNIYKAAREIISILSSSKIEAPLAELISNKKYSDDTMKQALVILMEIGIISSSLKNIN